MEFDSVVVNPPYYDIEIDDFFNEKKTALYNQFIEQAMQCYGGYMTCIIPDDWTTETIDKDLVDFREKMIGSHSICQVHTFNKLTDALGEHVQFSDNGVCILLCNREQNRNCDIQNEFDKEHEVRRLENQDSNIIITSNIMNSIIEKVCKCDSKQSIMGLVHDSDIYGLPEKVFKMANYYGLPYMNDTADGLKYPVEVYGLLDNSQAVQYVDRAYPYKDDTKSIDRYKLFIDKRVNLCYNNDIEMILAGSGALCTESYIMVGPVSNTFEQLQLATYIQSSLVKMLLKFYSHQGQIDKTCFKSIPLVSLNKIYTDSDIFKLFGLSEKEIKYIKDSI